jgi:2-dehydropantoate 2-reductase
MYATRSTCIDIRKIHILGGNKVGYLIAHSLRASCSPSTVITLHFHRLRQADTFNALYGLTLTNPYTGIPSFRDGFHYDLKDVAMRRAVPIIPDILEMQRRKEYVPAVAAETIRTLHEEAKNPPKLDDEGFRQQPIEVVIIAKRGGESLKVVDALKHRLSRNSTIVLIHNGMGVLSRIQAKWPREADRPNIVEGFSTHGLSNSSEFTINHAYPGSIHLGIAPRLDETDIFQYHSLSPNADSPIITRQGAKSDHRLHALGQQKHRSLKFILDVLLSDPVLGCTLRAYLPDLYLLQIKRVICQSILQVLGALHRCSNAELISVQRNHEIIGKLIKEILPVLKADPLISSSPIYKAEFTFPELYASVRYMALAAPNAVSWVLQDMAGRRETELGHLSGFLLLLAKRRGFQLPMWRTLHELLRANARLQQERHNLFVPLVRGQDYDGDGEVMELPDGTGVFEKRYWRLRPVQEDGQVELPPETTEELPTSEGEDDVETMELFATDTGRSPLSQKLRISSSATAEATVKGERTLPRIRNVSEVYHPWDPFKRMDGERKRRIADMRKRERDRRKAKRAKREAAALPAQATPDSAVASDAGQPIDQGVVSDSQMVGHILQQLESTSETENSRPAAQSSPFDDQTSVPESVEIPPAEDESPLLETPTTTAEIFAGPSSSPELQSTRPSSNQITTDEEKSARLAIETKSGDPTEPTTKEEEPLALEISSQISNSIEVTIQDETPELPPHEEISGIEETATTAPELEAPPKRGRGRPKGSKNRPKD